MIDAFERDIAIPDKIYKEGNVSVSVKSKMSVSVALGRGTITLTGVNKVNQVTWILTNRSTVAASCTCNLSSLSSSRLVNQLVHVTCIIIHWNRAKFRLPVFLCSPSLWLNSSVVFRNVAVGKEPIDLVNKRTLFNLPTSSGKNKTYASRKLVGWVIFFAKLS